MEARGIFNSHKDQIRDFLEDPVYGSGRESMTVEEYGARFQFGGGESEGTGVNEGDPAAVADLVPLVEAEVVSSVEEDVSFQAVETGGGRRRDPLRFRVGSVLLCHVRHPV